MINCGVLTFFKSIQNWYFSTFIAKSINTTKNKWEKHFTKKTVVTEGTCFGQTALPNWAARSPFNENNHIAMSALSLWLLCDWHSMWTQPHEHLPIEDLQEFLEKTECPFSLNIVYLYTNCLVPQMCCKWVESCRPIYTLYIQYN